MSEELSSSLLAEEVELSDDAELSLELEVDSEQAVNAAVSITRARTAAAVCIFRFEHTLVLLSSIWNGVAGFPAAGHSIAAAAKARLNFPVKGR